MESFGEIWGVWGENLGFWHKKEEFGLGIWGLEGKFWFGVKKGELESFVTKKRENSERGSLIRDEAKKKRFGLKKLRSFGGKFGIWEAENSGGNEREASPPSGPERLQWASMGKDHRDEKGSLGITGTSGPPRRPERLRPEITTERKRMSDGADRKSPQS